jgi:hypothetical protein
VSSLAQCAHFSALATSMARVARALGAALGYPTLRRSDDGASGLLRTAAAAAGRTRPCAAHRTHPTTPQLGLACRRVSDASAFRVDSLRPALEFKGEKN